MKKRMHARAGYILAVVLAVCSVSFFLIVYCGLTTAEFNLMHDIYNFVRAGDTAYALKQAAVAQLMYSPDWSEDFTTGAFSNPPASGFLTFRKGFAPYSVNNSAGTEGVQAWDGRTVPPGYVSIVTPAVSPDNTPDNPWDDGHGIRITRQALVNPYYQYWMEDFNKDGQDMARHPWSFSDAQEQQQWHLIRGHYCYMGGFDRDEPLFAEAGEDWWEDYDLEVIVAYYGYKGFGLMVRSADYNGYCALVSPVHNQDALCGASIQFLNTGNNGNQWLPFSKDAPSTNLIMNGDKASNPFLTDQPEFDLQHDGLQWQRVPDFNFPYALWKLTFSVENRTVMGVEDKIVMLTVKRLLNEYDDQQKEWVIVESGQQVMVQAFQPKSGDSFRKTGRIGIFCEPNTVIGFTNVLVKKRGKAMIAIPSQWYDE